MSRASPASITSEASGLLNSAEHNNLTSDYPDSELSSSTSTLGGQPPVFYNSRPQSRDSNDEEGFSHEDIIEDIEDGTSSVLSSSLQPVSVIENYKLCHLNQNAESDGEIDNVAGLSLI